MRRRLFLLLVFVAVPVLVWAARDASEVVMGNQARDCDCPAATLTPTPTATASPSPSPSASPSPTPTPSASATPPVSIENLPALGYPAVWEQPDVLLITLSGEATQFEADKDTVKPQAKSRLRKLVAILKSYPANELNVEGHTDDHGGRARNQSLSTRRAETILKMLRDMGVAPGRLQGAKGWAYDKPVADNGTPAGRALNRRVELRLRFYNYRPGMSGPIPDLTPGVPLTPTVTPPA